MSPGIRFLKRRPALSARWCSLAFASLVVAALSEQHPAFGETVEAVFSREHPSFDSARAHMEIGRDGFVYLASRGPPSVVMRVGLGGEKKSEHVVGDASLAAVSNGTVTAVLNGHFAHSVTFVDTSFREVRTYRDFLANDAIGWDAPGGVEVGARGDFYVLDQHRGRIVQFDPTGEFVGEYSIGDGVEQERVYRFRLDEPRRRFFLLTKSGRMFCVGFDGSALWSKRMDIGLESGGFDVEESGVLSVMTPFSDRVMRYAEGGAEAPGIPLDMGEHAPARPERYVTSIRRNGEELVVKMRSATELFSRYDRRSGRLISVVASDHQRLRVSYDNPIWTAGSEEPLAIRQDGARTEAAAKWRVWSRPLELARHEEWPRTEKGIVVPRDASGIYELTVSTDTGPPRPTRTEDLRVRFPVEVRQPSTRATLSLFTPENRTGYARGDSIPFTVVLRGGDGSARPVDIEIRNARGRVMARSSVEIRSETPRSFVIPAALTSALATGRHTLAARGSGFSVAPQFLELGPKAEEKHFHRVQYGDYAPLYPAADVSLSADAVEATRARTAKLGFDLLVDRLGHPLQKSSVPSVGNRLESPELQRRLAAGPLATAPEKATLASTFGQLLAAYSRSGVQQMAILMGNDASLPIGDGGFDSRPLQQTIADLTEVTRALEPYSAFRGWSWSSNWWVFNKKGALAASSGEEKSAYEAAVRAARESGAWSQELDVVADRRLGYARDAQTAFESALRAMSMRHVTASAAPYRNVDSYPPISLDKVDEIDLQAQWEQVPVPGYAPHNVDFYTRPGKGSWAHPELYNDAGTGEQILPTLLSMVMRGARGVGTTGAVPNWGELPEDPRSAYAGLPSIYRAANELFERYGGWFAGLENDDRIAIVVSGRMLKIDEWAAVTGRYFAQVLEAYSACLHARHPASILFPEDLAPGALARYDAVLLVGQTVELEPTLSTALHDAQAAGRPVFYDQTSRERLVREFSPLGIAFDRFSEDRSPAGDDSAYWRFRSYLRETVPTLAAKLGAVSTSPVRIDDDDVLVSSRRSGNGRYLSLVNDTPVPLDVGKLWRMTLASASLAPREATVQIREPAGAIYDVFAMKKVESSTRLTADLRALPGAVFAFLPAEIGRVSLAGPRTVREGRAFEWSATVLDIAGAPLDTSIPLHARLVDSSGNVLEQHFVSSGAGGIHGSMTAPIGSDSPLTVEVKELFSGRGAAARILVEPRATLAPLVMEDGVADRPASADQTGIETHGDTLPSRSAFGPHIRDVAVSRDGSSALMTAMNWDDNLYVVDLRSGAVRTREKVGGYFAFSPVALDSGFAVQGFDFDAPEGYFLYRLDQRDAPEMRFGLYGLPQRLCFRFVPGILKDRIAAFAVAPDGSWVATAGNLGLTVWSAGGRILWRQDWWKNERFSHLLSRSRSSSHVLLRTPLLSVVDGHHFAIVDDEAVTVYDAASGATARRHAFPGARDAEFLRVSGDGRTIVIATSERSGRIHVLRGTTNVRTLASAVRDLSVSEDGSLIVVAAGNLLKLYSTEKGLLWTFSADDVLHFPRLGRTRDGTVRIAASSESGTTYALDRDGRVLLEKDLSSLAVPSWLPDGGLLLATWMGKIQCLDSSFKERWSGRLDSQKAPARARKPSSNSLRTASVTDWGNASPAPRELAPNLLPQTKGTIRFVGYASHVQFVRSTESLTDGRIEPPLEPWLSWKDIGWMAEMSAENFVEIELPEPRRIDAITLAEDPAHPESWLRDANLEYWNDQAKQWLFVERLLSNRPLHTHVFPKPIVTTKLRILPPWGFVTNLRWSEVVLHEGSLTRTDGRSEEGVAD